MLGKQDELENNSMVTTNSLSNIFSETQINGLSVLDTELYMVDEIETDTDGDLRLFRLSYVKLYPTENGWHGYSGVKSREAQDFDYLWTSKIKREDFLDNFCLVEVLSTAILSTQYGENIQKYTELRTIFSRLSIADRLKAIKALWPKDYPKGIGRLMKLRNQIVHSLEERRFVYDGKIQIADADFNKIVHKDMSSSLKYLLNILKTQQARISCLKSELTV